MVVYFSRNFFFDTVLVVACRVRQDVAKEGSVSGIYALMLLDGSCFCSATMHSTGVMLVYKASRC